MEETNPIVETPEVEVPEVEIAPEAPAEVITDVVVEPVVEA